jgi:NADPH-dependent F420 reductase
MNVTVVGAGNMGRGIGHRLVAGGHTVTVVDSNLDAAEKLAGELRSAAQAGATVQTASLENVTLGDVVVLAVWYPTNLQVAKDLGAKLANKIVVDISNPINSTYDDLATAPDTSSAEELAKVVPASAKVVKAFNTTFAGTLVAGNVNDQTLDVLLAGDDDAAKATVSELITDGSLVAVDAGPLRRARQLEALGLLGITLQLKHNFGFSTAWKLVQPQ